MNPLPEPQFRTIVKLAPLISIDLIVRDADQRMLLGLRRNRPAKDFWFVPGGRIFKNETLAQAFQRIASSELGTGVSVDQAISLGVFEHFYDDNYSDDSSFGTHYVVLAYELSRTPGSLKLPNEQHNFYRWLHDEEMLSDLTVHENTRAYARVKTQRTVLNTLVFP